MANKQLTKALRQGLDEQMFYRGEELKKLDAEIFGYEWQDFSGNGDRIKQLDTGDENVTTYLYAVPKGFKFPPHIHSNNEYIVLLSGSCKYEYIENGKYEVKRMSSGDFCSFKAGVPHRFHFYEDSLCQATYFPSMKKNVWSGELVAINKK